MKKCITNEKTYYQQQSQGRRNDALYVAPPARDSCAFAAADGSSQNNVNQCSMITHNAGSEKCVFFLLQYQKTALMTAAALVWKVPYKNVSYYHKELTGDVGGGFKSSPTSNPFKQAWVWLLGPQQRLPEVTRGVSSHPPDTPHHYNKSCMV